MEKKSVFFDVDKAQISKGKQVPNTNIVDKFVNASHNEDRVFNGFMSGEFIEKNLRPRRSEHSKVGTNEKMCKKGCNGCKMGLNKEISNIVS